MSGFKYIIALCIFFVFLMNLFSVEIEVIKNPKPTCIEKDFSTLVLVKTISNIDEKNFLVQPTSITADDKGNFYVYDGLQCRIFKFNQDNKHIKSFGRRGRGPGEFRSSESLIIINYGKDGNLYACDSLQQKFMSFTTEGKYIRDYKIKPWRYCQPVVDAKGNFYLPSARNGMIDVENREMNLIATLLSEKNYHRCLFIKPSFYFSRTEIFPNFFNTVIKLLSDSKIIIYNRNVSIFYVLDKNHQLIRQANLWPQKALASYKKRLLEFQKEEDFENAWVSFFQSFFTDEDKKSIFYLQTSTDEFKVLIYAFDLSGRLVNISKPRKDIYVNFQLKKNDLFYGFGSEGNIKIYKEELKLKTK